MEGRVGGRSGGGACSLRLQVTGAHSGDRKTWFGELSVQVEARSD